ncbi:hypothetical protein ACFWZS_22565 [[Kitasatospora] papulosa]|uniref:hypothetical protein n=1 Tax=[Kitasatospora] papulosa TaxID=1464011 RepID=UPI0036BC44F1
MPLTSSEDALSFPMSFRSIATILRLLVRAVLDEDAVAGKELGVQGLRVFVLSVVTDHPKQTPSPLARVRSALSHVPCGLGMPAGRAGGSLPHLKASGRGRSPVEQRGLSSELPDESGNLPAFSDVPMGMDSALLTTGITVVTTIALLFIGAWETARRNRQAEARKDAAADRAALEAQATELVAAVFALRVAGDTHDHVWGGWGARGRVALRALVHGGIAYGLAVGLLVAFGLREAT